MADIVERLRSALANAIPTLAFSESLWADSLAELVAVRAEAERLRAALKATAAMGSSFWWSTRLQEQVQAALGEPIGFGRAAARGSTPEPGGPDVSS